MFYNTLDGRTAFYEIVLSLMKTIVIKKDSTLVAMGRELGGIFVVSQAGPTKNSDR
jgi:hypothetical protein